MRTSLLARAVLPVMIMLASAGCREKPPAETSSLPPVPSGRASSSQTETSPPQPRLSPETQTAPIPFQRPSSCTRDQEKRIEELGRQLADQQRATQRIYEELQRLQKQQPVVVGKPDSAQARLLADLQRQNQELLRQQEAARRQQQDLIRQNEAAERARQEVIRQQAEAAKRNQDILRQQEAAQRAQAAEMARQQEEIRRQQDQIREMQREAERNAPVQYKCRYCKMVVSVPKSKGTPSSFDCSVGSSGKGGFHSWSRQY